jgi:hypothetical protein
MLFLMISLTRRELLGTLVGVAVAREVVEDATQQERSTGWVLSGFDPPPNGLIPVDFRTGCFAQCEVDGRVQSGIGWFTAKTGIWLRRAYFAIGRWSHSRRKPVRRASGKMRVFIP